MGDNTPKIAGLVFIEMALILSFTTLNGEIQAIASAEAATAIETLSGLLFPYVLIFLILMFGAVIVAEVLK